MEIENARIKQDLKRLRETISNNNNHDEASMDQMKELMDQFETLQVRGFLNLNATVLTNFSVDRIYYSDIRPTIWR